MDFSRVYVRPECCCFCLDFFSSHLPWVRSVSDSGIFGLGRWDLLCGLEPSDLPSTSCTCLTSAW